jgi:hypothetical protein
MNKKLIVSIITLLMCSAANRGQAQTLCSHQERISTEFFGVNFLPALEALAEKKGLKYQTCQGQEHEHELAWRYYSDTAQGQRLKRAIVEVVYADPTGINKNLKTSTVCIMVECVAKDAAKSISKMFQQLDKEITP